jgi:hypothetical protein
MQQAHEKRLVGVGGLSLPKIRHSMKNRGYVCLHYDHMAHKRNQRAARHGSGENCMMAGRICTRSCASSTIPSLPA